MRYLTSVLCLTVLLGLAAPQQAEATTQTEEAIREAVNAIRAQAGRPALVRDPRLEGIARDWSASQAAAGVLSHHSGRMALYAFPVESHAENIGYSWAPGASERELADRIVQAWLDSPGHRSAMLGDWTDVGIGAARDGAGRLWVTADFIRTQVQGPASEVVSVSQALFGADTASHAVLARSDEFPDALAGATLAGSSAPLFLTRPGQPLPPVLQAELERILPPGAPVFLIGGSHVLTPAVADGLRARGLDPQRVAGGSRVETAVAAARARERLKGPVDTVLIAAADGWADAIAAAPWAAANHAAVLLTEGDRLSPVVADYLAERPRRVMALGGERTLSGAVVSAAGAHRIAGADRAATAAAVVEHLWQRPAGAAGDRYVLIPGWSADGWAAALAHLPYASGLNAPLLPVSQTVPPAVSDVLRGLGHGPGRPAVLRATLTAPPTSVQALRDVFG